MFLHYLKIVSWRYPRAVFAVLGVFWLLIAPAIGLTGRPPDLTYLQLLKFSAAVGVACLLVDGLCLSGCLKRRVQIRTSGFDTTITVMFGDLFKLDGWKAVAVNDFFDSKVDEVHIASQSLHGQSLTRYWGGNMEDWDKQVQTQLSQVACETVARESGKSQRYDVGSTAACTAGGEKLLFVVLTHTDIETLETRADSRDLIKAVRGLLTKARTVCAKQPLNIPLMGSGLARIGIKSGILVDLILTAVFEETKLNKITDEIRIVLPVGKMSEINLAALKQDWS